MLSWRQHDQGEQGLVNSANQLGFAAEGEVHGIANDLIGEILMAVASKSLKPALAAAVLNLIPKAAARQATAAGTQSPEPP